MTAILIATRNAHKVGEIRAILGNGFQYLTLQNFPGAPAVIEDADTFAGNAKLKATGLARALLQTAEAHPVDWVLADDSGLEVDVLNGAPGVHSARFAALDSGAEGNSSDRENRVKLLRLLEGVPLEKRTARFRCVVALTPLSAPSDELENRTETFQGACEGRILFGERGGGGFGYDSLFLPEGYDRTFGELSEEEKNRISHRAKALGKISNFELRQ